MLAKGVPSPLAKESDEEKGEEEGGRSRTRNRQEPDEPRPQGRQEAARSVVKVDPGWLSQRILALPLKAAGYADLAGGRDQPDLLPASEPGPSPAPTAALYRYDLEKRKEDTLAEAVNGFEVSRDGKRVLVQGQGRLVDLSTCGRQARPREVQAERSTRSR